MVFDTSTKKAFTLFRTLPTTDTIPVTTVPTTVELPTAPTTPEILYSSISPISVVHSTRRPDLCIFKRFLDSREGQDLWFWLCPREGSHILHTQKFEFTHDLKTGLVKHDQSGMCWKFDESTKRLQLQKCDETSLIQKFTSIENAIRPVINKNYCIKPATNPSSVVFQDCP